MAWLIDRKVNLIAACAQMKWHRASAIDLLVEQDIVYRDAEAFVDFAFTEEALKRGGNTDGSAEDAVTEEQWSRLWSACNKCGDLVGNESNLDDHDLCEKCRDGR